MPPLTSAAVCGDMAEVAALIADGADVNEPMTDEDGGTPLLLAVYKGHAEVVTTLLAANADVDQPTNKGQTPLHLACWKATPRSSRSCSLQTPT